MFLMNLTLMEPNYAYFPLFSSNLTSNRQHLLSQYNTASPISYLHVLHLVPSIPNRPRTSSNATSSCPAALSAASSWVWPPEASESQTYSYCESHHYMHSVQSFSHVLFTSQPDDSSLNTLRGERTSGGVCVQH